MKRKNYQGGGRISSKGEGTIRLSRRAYGTRRGFAVHIKGEKGGSKGWPPRGLRPTLFSHSLRAERERITPLIDAGSYTAFADWRKGARSQAAILREVVRLPAIEKKRIGGVCVAS